MVIYTEAGRLNNAGRNSKVVNYVIARRPNPWQL